jgi:glycosyltransferase involved in cell wall biosynthesis
MNKISVVINTYNAEKHLQRVLDSVKTFDEVLVCDMESTDDTISIARENGCRVVTYPKGEHTIVEPAREFAIHEAKWPWVLVVDADELVTSELRDYLYDQISRPDCPMAIAIPRKNYFMNRFLHSAYPDHIVRFFRQDKTHWPPVIHCSPVIDGRVEKIPAKRKEMAFVHLANDTIDDIIQKTDNYINYELPRRRHKNYGVGALLGRPLFRFFKNYLIKGGFRDGLPGLIHATLAARYQFLMVSRLMEERTLNKPNQKK